MSPDSTVASCEIRSSEMSPVTEPPSIASVLAFFRCTFTDEAASVINCTRAASEITASMRPARPSLVTTGMPRSMPSFEPRLMMT